MSASVKFLLGCDPEWFLRDVHTGEPRSAIGRFMGTKKEPVPLEDGVSVQVDNVAVEYGITPATSEQHWVDLNHSARIQIAALAAKHNCNLLITPSVIFPETELNCEAAWLFGCEPDLNAWTKEWNPKPEAANPLLRSAGAHLHFGLDYDKQLLAEVVKATDMYIAVPGLLVDPDDRRRELYGKAGACRFKPYGVEWRTGSNFWTANTTRIRWVYRTVNSMLEALAKGLKVPAIVREIIDTGDRGSALLFCKQHGLEVPSE